MPPKTKEEMSPDRIESIVEAICEVAAGLIPDSADLTVIIRMPMENGTHLELIQSCDKDPKRLAEFIVEACGAEIAGLAEEVPNGKPSDS